MHAQADAGSFIIDGARRCWIMDLGPDDYDLPGYFDHGADDKIGTRWRYYRTHAAGHNTLVIDGRNQIPSAQAPITGSNVDGDCKWVVFDLSAAYGKPPNSIRRGAALAGREVLIQDEIGPGSRARSHGQCTPPPSPCQSAVRLRVSNSAMIGWWSASSSLKRRASNSAFPPSHDRFRSPMFANSTATPRSHRTPLTYPSCRAAPTREPTAPQEL